VDKDSMIYDFIKTCYENTDTRKIAIFFTINLSFMFVELVYGYLSNSLGLISDSFHMLFDCMALFIGLCASYIAKLPADKQYTYGFGRVETLSGLFNGIFLVFIAFNVFCESIERIFEPQMIETDGLLLVSFLGLGVNMIGLFFFHDHHDHGGQECAGGHDHGHDNENMYGVFLHILADCLGSVGVIISSMLVKYYGFYVADPICSFIISLMILASSVPFIQLTASTLILKNSKGLSRKSSKIKSTISKLEGVV
jgi:zinc transporter 5/7